MKRSFASFRAVGVQHADAFVLGAGEFDQRKAFGGVGFGQLIDGAGGDRAEVAIEQRAAAEAGDPGEQDQQVPALRVGHGRSKVWDDAEQSHDRVVVRGDDGAGALARFFDIRRGVVAQQAAADEIGAERADDAELFGQRVGAGDLPRDFAIDGFALTAGLHPAIDRVARDFGGGAGLSDEPEILKDAIDVVSMGVGYVAQVGAVVFRRAKQRFDAGAGDERIQLRFHFRAGVLSDVAARVGERSVSAGGDVAPANQPGLLAARAVIDGDALIRERVFTTMSHKFAGEVQRQRIENPSPTHGAIGVKDCLGFVSTTQAPLTAAHKCLPGVTLQTMPRRKAKYSNPVAHPDRSETQGPVKSQRRFCGALRGLAGSRGDSFNNRGLSGFRLVARRWLDCARAKSGGSTNAGERFLTAGGSLSRGNRGRVIGGMDDCRHPPRRFSKEARVNRLDQNDVRRHSAASEPHDDGLQFERGSENEIAWVMVLLSVMALVLTAWMGVAALMGGGTAA